MNYKFREIVYEIENTNNYNIINKEIRVKVFIFYFNTRLININRSNNSIFYSPLCKELG